MNQPERYSKFILPAGVHQAVDYKPDTKMRAAGTFTIWLEDHTLGNLLREQLHDNPEVVFAGYRIPHPLNSVMNVRIQTTEHSNPPDAMKTSILQLSAEVRELQQQLGACAPRDPHPQQYLQQQQQQQQQQQYPADTGYGGYGAPAPQGGYGGYQPAGGGGGGGGGYNPY